jgi:hypothetical protein
MKKMILITLMIAVLLTSGAFAEEKQQDMKFNVAARYYPATLKISNAPDYTIGAIWLEGNLFVGKDSRWKGSIEWIKGNDTKTVTGVSTKIDNCQLIGRIGYDVWEKLYLGLDYKSNKMDISPTGFGTVSRTFRGLGIGAEKHFDLSKDWPAFAAIHYYPTLTGPGSLNFRAFEYEAGIMYRWPKAVDISVGYRGETWCGYDNASNTNINFSGPYIGISKEF